jgi:hypothetical protein
MVDMLLDNALKGRPRELALEATGSGSAAYAELIYDLFGEQKAGLVCAFISARQGEGASETSRGVALGLSYSAEIRRRRIALVDGVSLLAGRSLSELTPMEDPSRGEPSGIFAWPAREGLTSNLEVVSALTLADSLTALRAKYDYVILNCPSADSAGLAASLAASADKTVLVVRAGGARRREILNARSMLSLRGAPLVGCVLLDQDLIPTRKPGL